MIATSTIQAYKDNTKRKKTTNDSRIQFICLCHSLPVKIHKFAFIRNQFSKPCQSVSLSVSLHSPPAPISFCRDGFIYQRLFKLFCALGPAKQTVCHEKSIHSKFVPFGTILLGLNSLCKIFLVCQLSLHPLSHTA